MIGKFFYWIWQLETKYLKREVRQARWYYVTKTIVLLPFVLLRLIGMIVFGTKNRKTPGERQREDVTGINLSNIIAGFGNLAFPDKEVEALAIKRAEICAECPAATKTGMYSMIVDNRTKDIQGMKCSDCGCNLSAKVRSVKDHCPRGKW